MLKFFFLKKDKKKIITESPQPRTTITNCVYKNFMNIEHPNNSKFFSRLYWKNWDFLKHKCLWMLYNNNKDGNENTACTTFWVSYFCMSFILVVTILNEHVVYHYFFFSLLHFTTTKYFILGFLCADKQNREKEKEIKLYTLLQKKIHVNKKDQKSTYMSQIWGHATTERGGNTSKKEWLWTPGHGPFLLYNNVLSIMCLR